MSQHSVVKLAHMGIEGGRAIPQPARRAPVSREAKAGLGLFDLSLSANGQEERRDRA